MKAYLYLEPYVYLSLAGDSVLLYNTLSSSCYTFNNGSLCKIAYSGAYPFNIPGL